MNEDINLYDSDKDDPDYVYYSSDSGDELPDSIQQDSLPTEPINYSHFSYQDFSIPEQILPLTGDDSDFCYGADRYTELSSIGFEAMKESCDFFNSLIDQNDELHKTQDKMTIRGGLKSKSDQKPPKRNIIYPYAFYKKSKRRQPPKTKISSELQGSVGQANILAAQGNHKDAVEMCLKLIESSPTAWEPLHTLAFVYKESGDQTKYLEYLLACAQIKKNDCQLWGQLGREFFQLERSEWAKACYERAVRCKYTDSKFYESIFSIIKLLIPLYTKSKQESKLLANLQCLLPHLYPQVNVHVFETYLKLYATNKNYLMIYNEVIQCFHIPLSTALYDEDNKLDIDLCETLKQMETDGTLSQLISVLDILPSNILVLFAVCSLNLFPNPYIVTFFMDIIMKSPKSDCAFTLINVLYRQGYSRDCLDYFNYVSDNAMALAVKDDPNISLENDHFYGWLNVAECYWRLNNDQSINVAFSIYIELLDKLRYMQESRVPQYYYVYLIATVGYLRFSKLQQAYDQIEYYLNQEISLKHNTYIVDFASNLIEDIFKSHKHKIMTEDTINEEFIRSALLLLWINRYDADTIEQRLPVLLQSLGKMLWCVDNTQLLTPQSKKIFLSLFHRHMNQILDRLKLPILYSFREEICWRFISFCVQNKWHNSALSTLFKQMTACNDTMGLLDNNFFWNVFSLLLHKIKLTVATRRIMSLALGHFTQHKAPPTERALLASAHNRLINYKNYRALEKYYLLCFHNPREPIYFLYMAVSLANVAFRKHIDNYCSVALQSACVMQHYFKLKGGYSSQEACYNMGRCYHQLKMFNLAIPLYEKALAIDNSEINLIEVPRKQIPHDNGLTSDISVVLFRSSAKFSSFSFDRFYTTCKYSMKLYTLVNIVLVGLAVNVQSLYDKQSPVIQLDSGNFDSEVLNDDSLWLIEFYADWCGHCKALAPEYIKVAERFKGLIKIAAVNADQEKELAAKYQIQGYPTLKLFGRDKNKPKDLQSGRNANAITEAVIKYLKDVTLPTKKPTNGGKPEKDGDQYLLTTDNFDSFLKSADKPVLVKFFAPWCGHCKAMAGDFKAAATDLKDVAYLAKVDATVETELAQRYQLKGFPTLKVFINTKGKITSKEYNGGRSRDEITEWVKSNTDLPPPYVETLQVSNQKEFEERCISKLFCVISFLPPMEDSSEKERLAMIKQLNDAAASSTGVNWGWIWIEGGLQDKLEQALNVDQLAYPIVVGIHPGKKVYGVLKTAFKQKNIEDFVKTVKVGKAHISSYKSVPTLEETKPWPIPSDKKKSKDEL